MVTPVFSLWPGLRFCECSVNVCSGRGWEPVSARKPDSHTFSGTCQRIAHAPCRKHVLPLHGHAQVPRFLLHRSFLHSRLSKWLLQLFCGVLMFDGVPCKCFFNFTDSVPYQCAMILVFLFIVFARGLLGPVLVGSQNRSQITFSI